MAVSEKTIEQELCQRVKELGGLCLKWVSPGCAGVPDRITFLPGGQIHFVELKAPGKSAKPRQRVVIAWLRRLGCYVWELNSLEDVEMMIKTVQGKEVMS